MDGNGEIPDRDAHDGVQILIRIVERMAFYQGLVDIWQRAPEQQGVAVWTCSRDCGSTQGSATAADILNDDCA
jgi:hypothetical protein